MRDSVSPICSVVVHIFHRLLTVFAKMPSKKNRKVRLLLCMVLKNIPFELKEKNLQNNEFLIKQTIFNIYKCVYLIFNSVCKKMYINVYIFFSFFLKLNVEIGSGRC